MAMRRLGAPPTRRWALQEKVAAPMLNSQANIPRGANPKHILTGVYDIEVAQAGVHYSHREPAKSVWGRSDLSGTKATGRHSCSVWKSFPQETGVRGR